MVSFVVTMVTMLLFWLLQRVNYFPVKESTISQCGRQCVSGFITSVLNNFTLDLRDFSKRALKETNLNRCIFNVTQGQYIDLAKGNYMNRAEIQNHRFGAQEV